MVGVADSEFAIGPNSLTNVGVIALWASILDSSCDCLSFRRSLDDTALETVAAVGDGDLLPTSGEIGRCALLPVVIERYGNCT